MRRLTLLRHAHAGEAAAGGGDFERPLNALGARAARGAAAALRTSVPRPGRLLVSPALRTRQTAATLCELGYTGLVAEFPDALYLATVEALLDEIRTTSADCPHVLLVGHNPGLSELLARLAPEDPASDALAPADWRSLVLATASWSDVGR